MAPAPVGRRAVLIVAAWAAAVGALALNRHLVGVFYDDGLYAGLARALATGHGFSHPHLPSMPAAIHYPPVYPLVLAPLFGLLSPDAAGLVGKILNLVFAAAAAGLVTAHATRHQLLGDKAPTWLPPVLVGAAAAAVPVLTTQSVLFAEPLFALLLVLAVMCADDGRPWLAGVAAALCVLTRTVGVAAGAGVVYFLWRKDRSWGSALRAGVPVALASVAWLAWTLTHRHGIDPALAINYGSYGEVIKQAGLGAFGSSAIDLPRPLFAITLGGWLPRPLALPLGWLGLALGVYGLVLVARRSSLAVTLMGYCAILAIWPFPPDRFLWAILPWLGLVWAAGTLPLLRHQWLRVPAALVAAAAIVGFGIYEIRALPGRSWSTQAAEISANFNQLLPALRELPDTAVLAVDDESLVWLYTGRRAVPLFIYGYDGARETRPTPAEHRAYLERQRVTHVVLASASSPAAAELRALITAYPGWLEPVHSWPGGRWIFAVHP